MTIEIQGYGVQNGIVTLHAVDCSEENFQRLERMRDDCYQEELTFEFDSRNQNAFQYLRKWLKGQKATTSAKTWGEALTAVLGTVTDINRKYLVRE